MSETTPTPIEVNANALPALLTTLLRYVAGAVGGWLIGKGYITADQAPQVAGVLIAVATAGWGMWRTWRNHKKLVITAVAAPNKVAVVK